MVIDFFVIFIIFLLLLSIYILIRKHLNIKQKETIFKSLIIISVLGVISLILYFFLYKSVFVNSIYVVTKDVTNEEIYYYEVNDREYKRKTKNFDYDENDIYYLNGCFDSYIDRPSNKIVNYRLDACTIVDKNDNEINIDETLNRIIDLITDVDHTILKSKIIRLKNDYYVVVALNVNWHSPYELYKFKNNRLSYIYTFESEDVIAIKEKE